MRPGPRSEKKRCRGFSFAGRDGSRVLACGFKTDPDKMGLGAEGPFTNSDNRFGGKHQITPDHGSDHRKSGRLRIIGPANIAGNKGRYYAKRFCLALPFTHECVIRRIADPAKKPSAVATTKELPGCRRTICRIPLATPLRSFCSTMMRWHPV